MRKVTANLYMTLDGYGEFPKYPGSDVVTAKPDDQFKDMWVDRYDSVDTVVFGRRAYEDHANYFNHEAAKKRGAPEYMFEFIDWLDGVQKIVLSHNMKKTEWQNSRIMNGDLGEIIARLRAEPGKDIIVDGGPTVVQECVQRGLADDVRMAVMPVIYGRGKHYWGSMISQQTLKLLSVKTMPYGELVLHYEVVR